VKSGETENLKKSRSKQFKIKNMNSLKMGLVAIASLAGVGGALASSNYARHSYFVTAVTNGFKVLSTTGSCATGTAKVCKISVASTFAIGSTIVTANVTHLTLAKKPL
jgi:hypothetical protein